MRMSFVVLTHRRADLLCQLYETLRLGNPLGDWEMVVVDDAGDEETRAYLAPHPNVRHVLSLHERFNWARNFNAGAREASGDVLVFCNNDIAFLCERFVEPVHRFLRENPLVGALCPQEVPRERMRRDGYSPFSCRPGAFLSRSTDLWVWGAAIFMPRATWEATGGLEERLTGYSYEEAWIARQVLLNGQRVAWTDLEVVHFTAVSNPDWQGRRAHHAENLRQVEALSGIPNPYAPDGACPVERGGDYVFRVFSPRTWEQTAWRLDLGGESPRPEGYRRLDTLPGPGVDLVWDVAQGVPWPDSTVDALRAVDVLPRLPDRVAAMNECWRVLRPGGRLHVELASADGPGAFADPAFVSYWNGESFRFYTDALDDRERARRGIQARFRIERLTTLCPPAAPHPRVCAELVALK